MQANKSKIVRFENKHIHEIANSAKSKSVI